MSLRSAVVLMLVVAACGGSTNDGGSAPPGADLFAERVLGSNAGCVTCHSLDPDTVLVGPSLAGIGSRAATRIAGVGADEYLRQSIVDPDTFVVEGFTAGRMPTNWAEELSSAEIDALVAYLAGLR